MTREAKLTRKTNETEITLYLNVDGEGRVEVATGIPFFDHMLSAFARHARFDLELRAEGDLEVDTHHTIEDVGIALGSAVREIYLSTAGINRSGFFIYPMDEALALCAIDLSGRSHLTIEPSPPSGEIGSLKTDVLLEFFSGFVNASRSSLHIRHLSGRNLHHIYEAIFKAFGRALDAALSRHPRDKGIPSTKGKIE